jgi:hypothetical protein
MSTQAIDFSDLGGRPVGSSGGAIDFSDLGAKQVQPATKHRIGFRLTRHSALRGRLIAP